MESAQENNVRHCCKPNEWELSTVEILIVPYYPGREYVSQMKKKYPQYPGDDAVSHQFGVSISSCFLKLVLSYSVLYGNVNLEVG